MIHMIKLVFKVLSCAALAIVVLYIQDKATYPSKGTCEEVVGDLTPTEICTKP